MPIHATNRLRVFFAGHAGWKWFVLAAALGVIAGLVATAFHAFIELLTGWGAAFTGFAPPAHQRVAWTLADHHASWRLLLLITGGGLVSGWLVYRFAPSAAGGDAAAIDAFHQDGGRVSWRVSLTKFFASAATIASGGSCGVEGPVGHIGAGLGSQLSDALGLTTRDRRLLMLAGIGACVAALFRAPLAGALYASEILYRDGDLETDVIVPAAIASMIAHTVHGAFLPEHLATEPLLMLPHTATPLGDSALELGLLAILALALSASGIAFISLITGIRAACARLAVWPPLLPMAGALLCGIVALSAWGLTGDARLLALLGRGSEALHLAVYDTEGAIVPIAILLAIAFGKMVTTALIGGTNGAGGVFGPSMVIGACLAAGFGRLLAQAFPGEIGDPAALVVVGMTGFFAGVSRAPISTVLMVWEVTGHQLLLPTMWVSTLCFLLCSRWTLYPTQVANRLESPAHRGDFIVDVLEGISVRDVMGDPAPIQTVPQSMTLDRIVHMLAETRQVYFPVVDGDGKMVGIFSASDVRQYLYDDTIWTLTVAADVMVRRFLFVTPDDDLNTALRRFTERNIDELPVMAADDPGRLLGMLRRKEAIGAYNQRLAEQRRQVEEAG